METSPPSVDVLEGRSATVAGTNVVRVLPTKGRRTVGPWCFVDCITPPDFDDPHPMEVGPHPHTGLATVTWLFEGEALHGDSLGTEQLIRPGQVNLMTAGNGIAHAELGVAGQINGVQMWLAQPEETRHGESRFQHEADLPTVTIGAGQATLLLGGIDDVSSPVRFDSPLIGMQVRLGPGAMHIPLERTFEHAMVPIDHPVKIEQAIVEPGWLGLVTDGTDEITVEAGPRGAVLMLVGGPPMDVRIQMWWNFVARSRDELTQAWRDWQNHNTDRFGPVPSQLARIDAPPPPWLPGHQI